MTNEKFEQEIKLPTDPALRLRVATQRIEKEITFLHESKQLHLYDIEKKAFDYAMLYACSEKKLIRFANRVKERLPTKEKKEEAE